MADARIRITANVRQAERALGRVNQRLGGISGAARTASAALATVGAGAVIRSIVNTTARMQDLRDTLTTVTGSVQAGSDAFDFLAKQQAKTQFSMDQLSNSFVQLRANGVEPTELGLKNMDELFTVLTDSAAAVNGGVDVLSASTQVLSRSLASGTVELEELNKLADRGIPVFTMLKDRLGLTRTEISEFSKEGDNARLVLRTLVEGIQDSFGGATQRRINNVSTQFSNLTNAITLAADEVGRQGLAAALGATADEITHLINNNEALIQQIGQGLVKGFLYLKEAIKVVIANIEFLGKAFAAFFALKLGVAFTSLAVLIGGKLVKGLKFAALAVVTLTKVMKRNPILFGAALAIAGIEKLTGAISKFLRKIGIMEKATEAIEGVGEGFETMKQSGVDAADAIGINIDSLESLGSIQDRVNTQAEEFRLAMEGVSDTADDVTSSVSGTADASERSADAAARTKTSFEDILKDSADRLNTAILNTAETEEQRVIMQAQQELGRELTQGEENRLTALTQTTLELERQNKIQEQMNKRNQQYVEDIQDLGKEIRQVGTGGDIQAQITKILNARTAALAQYSATAEGTEQEIADARVQIAEEAQRRVDEVREKGIKRALEMEQGMLAKTLSKSDREVLQRRGDEERKQEIVKNRIEFEKKNEMEKSKFLIDQSAKVFDTFKQDNKEAFEAAKAFNTAQALMNTALAFTKALASYPPPFNYIAAAAVAASGAAQVSQIQSQSYSGRALGGPVSGSDSYIVGERGPELFTPNTSGQVTRNSDVKSSQPVNVNFNIQANDASGFDELLQQRRGMITQMVNDAVNEKGKRGIV